MIVKWTGIKRAGDTGAPFVCPNYPDKSVQAVGNFSGATVIMEGTNMVNDPTYFSLQDAEGDGISFNSPGGRQILENSYAIRPRITSGGNDYTDVDIYLLVTSQK